MQQHEESIQSDEYFRSIILQSELIKSEQMLLESVKTKSKSRAKSKNKKNVMKELNKINELDKEVISYDNVKKEGALDKAEFTRDEFEMSTAIRNSLRSYNKEIETFNQFQQLSLERSVECAKTSCVTKNKKNKQKKIPHKECVICMSVLENKACIPCGHMCVCIDCSQQIEGKECPICREHVTSTVRIFFC